MRTLRSSWPLVAAFVALSAPSVHAQPASPPTKQPLVPEKAPVINPEALQVVQAMLGTYQAMGSYSGKIHVVVESAGNVPDWLREGYPLDSTLQWQRPSSLRFEGTIADKKFLALSDGKMMHAINPQHPTLWVERKQTPIYHVATGAAPLDIPLQPDPPRLDEAVFNSQANAFSLAFMTDPQFWARTMKDVRVLALEPDAEVEGVLCRVVNAQTQSDDGHTSLLRLFIGRDDKMLRRLESSFTDMGGFKIVETDSQVQANPALPASTWAFQPPTNAKAVEEFPDTIPHEFDPAIKVGAPLPAFTGEDLNGQPLVLNPKSGKATVVEFFLMRSDTHQLQILEKLKKNLDPKKVQFLAVSGDALGSRLKTYAEKYKLTIPIYYDEGAMFNQLAQKFGVKGWPQMFIFGTDGKLKAIDDVPDGMESMTTIQKLFPGVPDDAFILNANERTDQ